MNWLKLSWKNIIHKPLSLTLSLVLFGLGVGLISLLFILQKQIQESFEKNLAKVDLVIGAKGSPLQMILSSMYHIDAPTGNIPLKSIKTFLNPRHPLIEDALPLSLGDSYRGYRIVGTETKILNWYNADIAEGDLWKRDFEVVLGANVADKLNLRIGDKFKSSHGLDDAEDLEHEDAHSLEVKGILARTGSTIDQLILTTPQTYWHIHDHDDSHEHDHDMAVENAPIRSLLEEDEEQAITNVLIKFKGKNFQALNLQRNINENTDMQAATPAIEITRLFSLMRTGEKALSILAIVIIIVSALSVFISLFSSLRERKYELALMRSMGASPNSLFRMIIGEGIILALLGFILGITSSHIAMTFVSRMVDSDFKYQFNPWVFVPEEAYLLLASLVIGLVAAVIPAWQARNTDIAETLLKD